MPVFSTDCEFEVYCGQCGKGLCNNCTETVTYNRQMNRLNIDPCENCLERAREEGGEGES